MGDQAAQQGAQQQSAASPKRRSFVAGLANTVASHPSAALAVIVVLLILVIGLVVYYRGFLFLGPYAKGAPRRKSGAKAKKDAGAGEAGDEQGDPETERLIETINRQ